MGIEIRAQSEREKPSTKFLKHKQTNNKPPQKKKKKAKKAKKSFCRFFAQGWRLLCCWSRVLVPCPVFWSRVLVADSSFAAVAATLASSFPSLSLSLSQDPLLSRPDPWLLSSSSTLLQLQKDPCYMIFSSTSSFANPCYFLRLRFLWSTAVLLQLWI